jgi:hypothetical protein
MLQNNASTASLNGTQPQRAVPIANSPQRLALDNLLRRELKVSDPNDAKEVAQALLNRYKDTPKAQAISREALGLPFLTTPTAAPVMQGTSSSDTEMLQAVNDVERDLQELTTNSILKDITPELQGWAMAIRSAIQEGMNAARFAIDTRQRDKTFGIRRTLGDYARVARLIGAMTPVVSLNYRKLAQSLDEVAAVLLVMMGEAISSIGFNSGRYLLQVAYSDLQARRDAVIFALRNLTGSTQEAYGPDDWQRGLNAYRQLYKYLEEFAQGDLRSLLSENELSRIMDSLLQRAGQGSAEGLRQLGATFQVDIERLRRLVIIGNKAVKPQSPPFVAFLDALQLFIDALQPSGGSRLIRIARPPILFYGLYGQAISSKDAAQNLLQIVIQRGQLADQLDRFAQSGIDPETVKLQILLDKTLYGIDRAIDLYAAGTTDGYGQPEYRAAAYSYLIDTFFDVPPPTDAEPQRFAALRKLVAVFSDEEIDNPNLRDVKKRLSKLNNLLFKPLDDLTDIDEDIQQLIQQELFIANDTERGWQKLVEAMAPGAVPYNRVFGERGVMSQLLEAAIVKAGDQYRNPEPKLPAHEAFSLSRLVKNTRLYFEELNDEIDDGDGGEDGDSRDGDDVVIR